MRSNYWNREKHLPNLLYIRYSRKLTAIIINRLITTENILISQVENDTIFDLKLIKRIQYMIYSLIYEYAGNYCANYANNNILLHPTAYLINDYMASFQRRILKLYTKHHNSIQYLALIYGELLYIYSFCTGNVNIVIILINLMLYKKEKRKIDFTLLNKISHPNI